MSSRINALVHVPSEAPGSQPQSSLGRSPPGLSPLPPEEPSVLWMLTVRYYQVIAVCGVVSLLLAWVLGRLLANPLWQAEAVLLYRPVPLTAEQQIAYPVPPSLGTLAGWIKDPRFLREALPELGLTLAPTAFADRHLKVHHQFGTETIAVSLRWSDPDAAREMLDRLLQRYSEFVAAERKQAILQGAYQTKQQELALCRSTVQRLEAFIQEFEARSKHLTETDLHGILLARRNDLTQTEGWRDPYVATAAQFVSRSNELQERIRRGNERLVQLQGELEAQLSDYARNEVAKVAVSSAELERLRIQCDTTRELIHLTQKAIQDDEEELRALPVRQAKMIQRAEQERADFYETELSQIELAMRTDHLPSGPHAPRLLTGMDAHEFKVESTWVDDRPASNNRRTLTALSFLVLMGLTFGLLLAYDRYHPAAGAIMAEPNMQEPNGHPLRALIHVAGRGVTIARADVQRLRVRIHQWIREDEETNGHSAPVTIGPDGQVEGPPQLPAASAPAADEADHLARRIHQWLGSDPEAGGLATDEHR